MFINTVASYPERGEGGNNLYRGNCSPKLIEDLIETYQFEQLSDFMAGSFTTQDACLKKHIQTNCYDLNHGFDLVEMDIPIRSENIFFHPPYWDIVQYSSGEGTRGYKKGMYSSEEVQKKYGITTKNDLSKIEKWEDFVKLQNFCTMKLFSSLDVGGRLCILMGDIKKKGRLYSQLCEIVKPGTIEQIIIKNQFNCTSSKNTYTRQNFVPISHEYLLILRKDYPLIIPVNLPKQSLTDIRNLKSSSWRHVLQEVMESLEGYTKDIPLEAIYKKIEGHRKCKENQFWKEKVRQTLQINDDFINTKRGYWKLAG